MTPLRPCPDDHVAPFRGLRHGQAPNARPPAPKLPPLRVDLVYVAPPTAGEGEQAGAGDPAPGEGAVRGTANSKPGRRRG